MGNSASKAAKQGARKFPTRTPSKDEIQGIKQAEQSLPRIGVASTRPNTVESLLKEHKVTGRDGEDPQELELQERLKKLGPVKFNPVGINPLPASRDNFYNTLTNRSKQQTADEIDIEHQTEATGKTLLPSHIISAIVRSLQQGVSVEDVIRQHGIKPSVIDKLKGLRVPEQSTLVQHPPGRRRPRNK